MSKFKDTVDSFVGTEFPVTPKGRIQQKEQIELKNDLTYALMDDLIEIGIECYPVQKGFVALVPNDIEGAIPVEINIITKPLDYDYMSLHDEYIEKQTKD